MLFSSPFLREWPHHPPSGCLELATSAWFWPVSQPDPSGCALGSWRGRAPQRVQRLHLGHAGLSGTWSPPAPFSGDPQQCLP